MSEGGANTWQPRVTRTNPVATTTQLVDISDDINTDEAKIGGYIVYNSTTSKIVVSVGAADGSLWNDTDGNLLHTPV